MSAEAVGDGVEVPGRPGYAGGVLRGQADRGDLDAAVGRVAVAYGVPSFSTADTIATILPLLFLAGLLAYTAGRGRATKMHAVGRSIGAMLRGCTSTHGRSTASMW